MAKTKELGVAEGVEEAGRVIIDADHVLITYADGSTEKRLV